MFSSIPVCRVCLKSSLEYIDLYASLPSDECKDLTIEQPTTSLTYMQISNYMQLKLDDMSELNVPQSLCEICAMELRASYRFLRKVEEANEILHSTMVELASKESCSRILDQKYNYLKLNNLSSDGGRDNIFECKNCMETFFSQYVLDLHIHRVHSFNISNVETNSTFAEDDKEEHLNLEMLDDSFSSRDTEYLSDLTIEDESKNAKETEKCTKCGEVFLSHLITEHMEIHKRVKNFKCSSCSYVFVNRGSLMHHFWKNHKSHCKICNKDIPQGESMRQHLQMKHSKMVECTECDHKCQEVAMRIHIQRAHAKVKDHTCDICYKSFADEQLLKAHLKYHKRKEANIKSDACPICGNKFSSQSYLQRHMKVHLDERERYQCDFCDKVYITKMGKDNHMRIHKGATINCDICGKGFSRRYELTVHYRFHTRDYPFKCEICDQKFAIKGHLRSHMWRHQGLKLQCEECGKLFTSSKALNEHSFLHTEMPFPCSYCPKGYPSKQKYKTHLQQVHLIAFNDLELQKVTANRTPMPLQRKRPMLVQTDTVLKEVEIEEQICDEPTEGMPLSSN